MKISKYSTQFIDKLDFVSIKKTLKSKNLSQGESVIKFENELSKFTKSKYSLSLNSATSALHVACLSMDLKKNDIVWTTPISFVSSANCALYCQSKIDFVDIDLSTFNISIEKLREKLSYANIKKRLPKVLIVVHLAGNPCDMKSINSLSKKYNFRIIEDASHALGARYQNTNIGSCRYSDITVFSYHPVKMITTGEGGSFHTNNRKIYNKALMYRSHGINKNVKSIKTKKIEHWYYEQVYLGFNYRMSDLNASLGISQLKKINKFILHRNKIANYYRNSLSKNNYIKFQLIDANNLCSHHLFIILIKENSNKLNFQLMNFLSRYGIGTQLHYLPIHLHPYYKKMGFKNKDFPNAEYYSNKALSIPIHAYISLQDAKFIISKINRFFEIA